MGVAKSIPDRGNEVCKGHLGGVADARGERTAVWMEPTGGRGPRPGRDRPLGRASGHAGLDPKKL